MFIREIFSEADVRRLAKVAREVWREANVAFCTPEQVEYMIEKFQSFEAITGQLMQGYRYFLIEDGDEILGYFGVQPQGERLFLSKFYILRQNRGRGLFSMGLQRMIDICKEDGLESIYLTVNRNNTHAYEVYLAKGFKVIAEECADIGFGFVMDDYIMEKDIE
ncbi:MAG: GNAT family N-acetyltransferase [Alistipes sp.]|nr:GNAT family N-acetyltransferase [Alistipes sp.]